MREDGGDGEAAGTLDVHEEATRRRYERLGFGLLVLSCLFYCLFEEGAILSWKALVQSPVGRRVNVYLELVLLGLSGGRGI